MTQTKLSPSDYRALAMCCVNAALNAGREIMSYYGGEIVVDTKSDESPVTAADRAGEAIILNALNEKYSDIPVIAEESASEGALPEIGEFFFLVDPLDGTREFVGRRDEFTVNIALVANGCPAFGVVYAPALSKIYLTLQEGHAAECTLSPEEKLENFDQLGFKQISVRAVDMEALRVVASRSHMDEQTSAFLEQYNVAEKIAAGSSIKFCRLARGDADLYPRFGRTMEWDTAAGHAVLTAAGGCVTGTDGSSFLYGKANQGFANPGFICWGKRN